MQVEAASIAESQVLEEKKEALFALDQQTIVGDNAYFKAMRVRNWAAEDVVLLTPATRWKNGRYARAYHLFYHQNSLQELANLPKNHDRTHLLFVC